MVFGLNKGWMQNAMIGVGLGIVAWWFLTKPGGISGQYNVRQNFGVTPRKLSSGFDVSGELDFPKDAYYGADDGMSYTSPTDRISLS